LREAEAECKESLSLHAGNPRAWVNLASTYLRAHAWPVCIEAATHAVEVKPYYAEAHYVRAVCLANAGRIPEAIDENRAALGIDPAHSGALSLASQMRSRGIAP
jgi:tetratricopeptide (TPR) repeat protein